MADHTAVDPEPAATSDVPWYFNLALAIPIFALFLAFFWRRNRHQEDE